MARQVWAVEDLSNGVAGLVHGRFETAQKEAMKLADFRRTSVAIYEVKGATWIAKGGVRWRP